MKTIVTRLAELTKRWEGTGAPQKDVFPLWLWDLGDIRIIALDQLAEDSGI